MVTTIEATLTAAGDVADFAEGTAANSACRSSFARMVGVANESVGLVVAGGSVQLTFVVVTSGESSKAAVVNRIEAALGTADAASEVLAVLVTSSVEVTEVSRISDNALAAGLTAPATFSPPAAPTSAATNSAPPPATSEGSSPCFDREVRQGHG